MTKRKPERVVVHRIELQTKERELFENYLYLQQTNNLIDSLTSMDPKVMYMYLTILEGFGLIDTNIPTLSDAPTTDEVLNAIRVVFKNKPVGTRGRFTVRDAIRYAITGEYPADLQPN